MRFPTQFHIIGFLVEEPEEPVECFGCGGLYDARYWQLVEVPCELDPEGCGEHYAISCPGCEKTYSQYSPERKNEVELLLQESGVEYRVTA
jgi:hypothetical protein